MVLGRQHVPAQAVVLTKVSGNYLEARCGWSVKTHIASVQTGTWEFSVSVFHSAHLLYICSLQMLRISNFEESDDSVLLQN